MATVSFEFPLTNYKQRLSATPTLGPPVVPFSPFLGRVTGHSLSRLG